MVIEVGEEEKDFRLKSELVKDDLLSKWKRRDKKGDLPGEIPKAPSNVAIPLSNGQKGLWFLQDLNKENSFYNYGELYDLKGDWSISYLKSSIRQIYESHDILRSSCIAGSDGLELKIDYDSPLTIEVHELGAFPLDEALATVRQVVAEDFTTPFELSRSPLLRVRVFSIDKGYHILSVTMHHIITDEWSMDIFMKLLAKNYRKLKSGQQLPNEKPELQFSDFAYWDDTRKLPEKELTFWKKALSNHTPNLALQTDFKRPVLPSYRGSHKSLEFSRKLSEELLNLATESEVTPFVLLLSLFYILLYRHTDQKDILVGSPIAKRNHKGLEDLLGFFLDTLVLRNEIDGGNTYAEVLAKVKSNTLQAFAHRDIPFDVLVKELNPERSAGSNPFFQVMFVYNTESTTPDFGEGLILEKNDLVRLESSKFDLTLFVSKKDGVLTASFEYATDLFETSTIDRLLAHLHLLAEGVVKNQSVVISELPMRTPEETALFSEISLPNAEHTDFNYAGGIHKSIEAFASRTPDAIAISFGNQLMTYSELNTKATTIASNLIRFTGGENTFIGLCIERSLDMIVGLLAVLKSGSAYVPLDPEYPKERLKYIVQDANATLVLTQDDYVADFEELGIDSISVSAPQMTSTTTGTILPEVGGNDLAYVIYTSGSTGKPKGVPISHQNILDSTKARFSFYEENPSAFLLLSSISFDSSKAGIFWTLCSGGNLVIAKKRLEQDMAAMQEQILTHKISHVLTLPTLYGLMLEHISINALSQLRTVIVAGEACPSQLPERHFDLLPESVVLYNEYGPTEATVWCTAHRIEPDDRYKSIPIGRAIKGAKIHLLDARLRHVPFGAMGEIYISGNGLSQGYLGKPELTKTKFVENPFAADGEKKLMYKSGDLGRFRADGNIAFLGRVDSQVKLRGFRIELDEIEETLLTHRQVKDAAVVIKPAEQGSANGILVAYLILRSKVELQEIKSFLKRLLPKHMVPAQIVVQDTFVKLPNGKVDKKYLETLPMEKLGDPIGPSEELTETEGTLIAIWEKILGFNGLAVDDNFFEIGGNSIMTIQVISEARKMGMVISPNQLFDYQTIRELAAFVDQNQQQDDQWDYMVPLRKEGSKKPLFCIHAGGGHVFFYNKLTDYLEKDTPIYALQPSGVYGDKAMHRSVSEMTRDYLEAIKKVQPQGPYNILVYCFSAAVGNEMALLLAEKGEKINLIVMDTMTAPAVLNTPRRLRIRIQTFLMRFVKAPFRSVRNMIISKYALIRLKWRSNFEVDEESRELEKLRVNLMDLSQTYTWKPFDGEVSLILTKKDHEALNKETVRSWQEVVKSDVTIVRTRGSHRELFDEPYVKYTAKAIEKCMFDH